ncbi:MAG: serine hydrolase, partial [Mycobacterium sp.]|nr:serine hydrolase [Mycobacterium sp.]
FDPATDSRWASQPAFPDARGGLVSSAANMLQFAGALLDGGRGVLSPDSITAMTIDRLTIEQRNAPSARLFLDGYGWGYGVQVVPPGPASAARYGWGGGLGTLWYTWPEQHGAAVLLTQVLPPAPELVATFLDAAEDALTD